AELLLVKGADVNARNKAKYTPLHNASRQEATDVAKTLLTHKAEVNAQSEGGETPLHLAAAWGRTPIVDLLLKAGADVNSTSKEGTEATPNTNKSHELPFKAAKL